MRILIFHGYLLRGTGSNVYNASLAQALKRMGHEIHLLCQDSRAEDLPWVGGSGPGSVSVHVPDIGGLLPVFVPDRYEGFEVKTFPEMTYAELDRYLEANVAAVREVVASYGEPDAALANHLIMGPVILARAGLRFALKVHGSDLSYTVRPHPDRFVPFAREGADAAAGVLVGSGHTADDLFATLDDPQLRAKTRLGPPGVDVHRFHPLPEPEALDAVRHLAGELEAEPVDESFGRDGPGAAAALPTWADGAPRVLYVGKLLVNKGIDLLVAAWPLVLREHSGARLLLAGFGGFRPGIEALLEALGRGDLDGARELAATGRAPERAAAGEPEGEPEALEILSAFLSSPPEGYAEAARAAAGSVSISGRLEHDEVAEVMPAADTLVMPSTFPEAFGMVAAEAAACAVPPVSADHSGMREVSRQLARALDPDLAPLLSFTVGPGAVEQIAERINRWLGLDPARRAKAGMALADRIAELWSWDSVAGGVIAASLGQLDALPEVEVG
jgi:glycosyltransferase involved in cell wall biosynthesis